MGGADAWPGSDPSDARARAAVVNTSTQVSTGSAVGSRLRWNPKPVGVAQQVVVAQRSRCAVQGLDVHRRGEDVQDPAARAARSRIPWREGSSPR
jgi:hypothetical protein